MAPPFEFSEVQAVDILDMQLRQLTRLSRIDLETELADVRSTILELEAILADDQVLRGVIKDELRAIREEFATDRVCQITLDPGDMSIEDLVDDKELVVVMTEAQYVKAVPAGSFKTQSRGGRGVAGAKLKTDDLVRHVIFTTAHAYLLFFSNLGKVYRLRALEIPERERTAKGMPIVNLLPLQPGETDPGDHRHPRLRRRALPVLRHPQGDGEEDGLRRLRLQPPGRPHRPQPARRRRAGAGDRDRRRRRHLHGVAGGA